jgi:DNA-binding response OmpR family regulator
MTTALDPVSAATILVVDDNEDNRAVLVRRLRKHAFNVIEADGGKAGLMQAELGSPDLILLDHMMPDMSGLEVLRCIRKLHDSSVLPVIMVTAHSGDDVVNGALEAGANDFITKPVNFPLLLARLSVQIARKLTEAQLKQVYSALDRRLTERRLELEDVKSELQAERLLRLQIEAQLLSIQQGSRAA